MLLQRYYLNCLAHASYLVADEETKTAAVIDPQRDVEQYLEDAAKRGLQIRYVFLTHFHADFVSGHLELKEKTGAKIYLGARAEAEFDFVPVKDGDTVEFGKVRLQVLETPGHTPESISLLLFDLDRNDRAPYAAFTGDTLFIGDVGRPDLLASIGYTADQLAEMLFDSLRNKLMALPDETLVYPAHGAGSLCGKQLSDAAYSTIGEQKKYNYALQEMSRDEFKRIVTADQPEAPAYFVHDAIMNRKNRPVLDDVLANAVVALPLEDVLAIQQSGGQVLDTRSAADFAGAHLQGSINIGLDGRYAMWCGSILDKEQPIVVIADEGREEEAIMRLGRIGFDHVRGYLAGGIKALDNRPELIDVVQRITATALAERLQSSEDLIVLDVRSEREWRAGHLEGSLNIPVNHLQDRMNELPRDKTLMVHCQSGYRSSTACSLLKRLELDNVYDVVGGYKAWVTSRLPVVDETAVAPNVT